MSLQVISNEEAVDLIKNTKDAQSAAKTLIDNAVSRKSKDDISCIVVRFQWKLQAFLLRTARWRKSKSIWVDPYVCTTICISIFSQVLVCRLLGLLQTADCCVGYSKINNALLMKSPCRSQFRCSICSRIPGTFHCKNLFHLYSVCFLVLLPGPRQFQFHCCCKSWLALENKMLHMHSIVFEHIWRGDLLIWIICSEDCVDTPAVGYCTCTGC